MVLAGGAQPLTWAIRMKVAVGAAKGLTFLHEAKSQVIYRDFKAANILLDAVINRAETLFKHFRDSTDS